MKAYIIDNINIGIKEAILSEYIRQVFECASDCNTADVIVTDLYSVESALKVKEQSEIPIVLFFLKSQQDKLFNIDTLCIDKLICVRDTPLVYNIPQLYPYEEILFPIPIHNISIEKSIKKENILVSLCDSMINGIQMYDVIRLLNRLTQYNITILHNDINIESICNSHISVTDQFDKIINCVENSSCIIGSGITAILALIYKKNLIVIGDTGYGGVPNHENLLNHRKNYFQGTVGMALGAPIPSFLLDDDIKSLFNSEQHHLTLKDELLKHQEKDIQQIRDIVSRLINVQKSREFELNNNLEVRNGGNFGVIIQRYTNQLLAELDLECLNTLKGILEGQSMDNLNQEAIQLLIENNIIVKK